MAFDPVTLLTISVMVLFALGATMLQTSRGEEVSCLLRWSGAAFLCLGVGFILVLSAPTDIHAPVRLIGGAALTLPYGLLWGAARRFDRRPAPFEAVVAGALAWLVAASVFDLSLSWRVGLTSAIVAAYSAATAWEHRRGEGTSGSGELRSQRWASRIFAAHSGFFAVRAVLGATLGLADRDPRVTQLWGGVLGLETVLVAVLIGVVSTVMSRERTDEIHRREALEDVLTGIGNRRALARSGETLLAACRRAGRPAALLLMDLDHFKLVNDRHGHPVGDQVLVAFARLAHDYLPPTSLVCRVGGEEFAAVLPGADAARARAVAEEIRALFAHLVLDGPGGPVQTTVSIGIAHLARGSAPEVDIVDLLARADLRLYAAKRGGRDRVEAEDRGDGAADPPPFDRSTSAAGQRSAA